MPTLSGGPVALSGSFFQSSPTPFHPVGKKGVADDGRVYRYCKAAATLVAGQVIQGPAVVPLHLGTVAVATTIGATVVTVTPGATAGAADLYADGFLGVSEGAGVGVLYGVAGHPPITSGVAFPLLLKRDEPLQSALTTASRLSLIPHPYNGVIQCPATTATGQVVGVAPYVISSGQYGWLQTAGLAMVLIAGTPALGAAVMAPGAVAGAASVIVAAGNLVVAQFVGHMAQVGVDTKYGFVRLSIAE